MKKSVLTLFFILCVIVAKAQNENDIEHVTNVVFNHALFILSLYEVVIRFYPTVKSYSFLSKLMYIINRFIPDRDKKGGSHN